MFSAASAHFYSPTLYSKYIGRYFNGEILRCLSDRSCHRYASLGACDKFTQLANNLDSIVRAMPSGRSDVPGR
jgi:hypothetical protein